MGKHTKKEDMDICDKCGKKGTNYTFVSFAIDLKTKKKGLLLCPKHEMRAVRDQNANE